jgi:8-oxo-dGTP diphosphatase
MNRRPRRSWNERWLTVRSNSDSGMCADVSGSSTSVPLMTAQIRLSVAALVRDGLVLLVHRHPSRRWYPDCWDLVGGHVETNELPHHAVTRECLEELRVHVHDPQPIPMTFSDPTLDMNAFLVTRWEGEPVNAAPEEHDDLRWFRPGELADLKMAHPASLSSILRAIQVATD